MRRAITVVLVTAGLSLSSAPAAFASANETHGGCVAQFTSNQPPGGVAETVSVLAKEAHPFGTTVVSPGANLKVPCEG